jgi:hypothetical protein
LFCPWSYLIQVSCTFLRTNEKPLVFSDKRQSQHWSLQFIWLSRGSRTGSRSQTSTWSGLIKAYTNKPFRMLCGRHNRALEIKQAICIFNSVCIHLQHSLSFPDLWSFLSWAYINIYYSACHYTCGIKFRTVFTNRDRYNGLRKIQVRI